MKKLTIYLLTMFCLLSLTGCAKTDNENTAESADNITAPATTETETQSEVLQFLIDKYDLKFRLWGPVEHDLYVFHVYPDHADYECHIMMPEKSDDIEQYWNDLEWEIIGDELIIKNHIGGEWTEAFNIDISAETATSTKTGRVYQICEIDPPLE